MYKLEKLPFEGCYKVIGGLFQDNRGFNRKVFQLSDFSLLKINTDYAESLVTTSKKNVLRGMHYQQRPYEQIKLIQCIHGSVLDVILDIRPDSSTFGKSFAIKMTAADSYGLYLPDGIAHGYLSLEENTVMLYHMSSEYNPIHENGILWDSFEFDWGRTDLLISDRDMSFQTFKEYKTVITSL